MEAATSWRQRDEGSIECWDDDGDLQCVDDIQIRTGSAATSVTGSSVRRSGHRDSVSSRRSARSDLDSSVGDEDWQVLLRDSDEGAIQEAIVSARNAGIPIPDNVPQSALLGGTIKRLGDWKARTASIDDWSEDLELFSVDGELELKAQDERMFPDTLRQVSSSLASSPVNSRDLATTSSPNMSPESNTGLGRLGRYRGANDVISVQDIPTIRIAQSRSQMSITACTPLSPRQFNSNTEDFEKDFELPPDGSPLKLSTRGTMTRTSSLSLDDFDDVEWAEGSIGVRFAGTGKDGRSNHSSSISAFSPSVSSCLTGESEEGLDGLVLPEGPLNLEESLKKRRDIQMTSLANCSREAQLSTLEVKKEDFFTDLEIGNGDVFSSAKLTLNQNIKRKTARPASPARRSATSITFTNKVTSETRIPRLSTPDRSRSNLEPVSESGAPISKFRRPHSRLISHTTHTSLPNFSVNNAASPPSTPSTVGRKSLGSGTSKEALKSEPTTTSAQFLKAKRSMPSIGNARPLKSALPFPRPPSRQDGPNRSAFLRPKTPVDRVTNEFQLGQNRRVQGPFLPAGPPQGQSHHAALKYTRHHRLHDSDGFGDIVSPQRSGPRISGLVRPDTPGYIRNGLGVEALTAAAKRTVTRPTRRRNFGDGTELESFDDLPTSTSVESKFIKNPVGHGAPKLLRSRLYQTQGASPSRTETPVPPVTPLSPRDVTPRFARDTNASRIAREQRIAAMPVNTKDRDSAPLVPLPNWKSQAGFRGPVSNAPTRNRKGKGSGTSSARPHLIKPLGTGVHEAKSVKDMRYNPAMWRWEGNENAVAEFDAICCPKSPKVAPALITNVTAAQGVQVVGGMVFDPQRMCWLKLAPAQQGKHGISVIPNEEEDIFAGLDDLEDRSAAGRTIGGTNGADFFASGDERSGGETSDDSPITEEFDVGPEFIKRQRAEEEKWRRKVEKWVTTDRERVGTSWRWVIRDLVASNCTLARQPKSSIV